MIHETKINLERNETYVDERLCCVNDMTFEELEHYQDYMIKYYGGYLGDGSYEEEYEDYESDEDDNELDEDDDQWWCKNCGSCPCHDDLCLSRVTSPGWHPGQNEDNKSDDENHDCVCLCDPTDFRAGTCCCNYLGPDCNGQCHPDGYDRWLEAQQATL